MTDMRESDVAVLDCPKTGCAVVVVGNTLDLLRHVRDRHPHLKCNRDGHMRSAIEELVTLALKERFEHGYDHPRPDDHR